MVVVCISFDILDITIDSPTCVCCDSPINQSQEFPLHTNDLQDPFSFSDFTQQNSDDLYDPLVQIESSSVWPAQFAFVNGDV